MNKPLKWQSNLYVGEMRVTGTTFGLLLLTGLFWFLIYLSRISEYDQNYKYFAYAALLSIGTFILLYRTAQKRKSDSLLSGEAQI